MRLSFLATSSALLLLCAAGFACSSTSTNTNTDGGVPNTDGGTDSGTCSTEGNGKLNVTITGAGGGGGGGDGGGGGGGGGGRVIVSGTSIVREMAGGELELPAGEYTIDANPITVADPIVRKVLVGTPAKQTVKVCGNATTNAAVAYSLRPSSNKVWMGNATGTAAILGYSSSVLGATATQPASVAAKTKGAGGIAFDRDGNLWVIGGTTEDPTLLRYPAASLGASGEPAADRKINVKGLATCFPFARSLAFDGTGNLWISLQCADAVVRLTPTDLASDGDKTPAVKLDTVDNPKGIAFDTSGNMWVAGGKIHAYAAARLNASSSNPADTILQVKEGNTLVAVDDLAFDKNGDLWAVGGTDTNLRRIPKADLGAPGSRDTVPAVAISVGVLALPDGIAFDEGGGLWIGTSQGKFARLGPSQLATPSTSAAPTVPETVITSSDVGSAGSIALYPAPADTPLYSHSP